MKFIKLLFLFFTCNLFSQNNFIPGTVTTNKGEVLNGFINYQDWKVTPNEIEFKQGEEIIVFLPSDIKAFGVKEDKFISRNVKLDVSEQNLQKMDKSDKPKFIDTLIFLNVLVEGNVNLYEFYNSRTHYFAEKEDVFLELINRMRFTDDNQDLITYKKYLGQLNVLLNDCQSTNINENINYKRKELTKLVSDYNNCVSTSNSEENYTKKLTNKTNHFYATLGYFISNFSLKSSSTELKNFEGGSLSIPSLGVVYEIGISKNRDKWSLYNELVYIKYNKEFRNEKESSSFTNYDLLNLEYSTLTLSSLFRYKFHKDGQKTTPFVNGGLGLNYVLSENTYVVKNNSFNQTQTNVDLELNPAYFSFSVGSGVVFNDFSAELRYTITDKILSVSPEQSNLSNLGIVVSYRIN